jgi:hypothetical protein
MPNSIAPNNKYLMAVLITLIWLLCTSFTYQWSPISESGVDDFYVVEYKPEHGGWRDWIKVVWEEGKQIYEVWIEQSSELDCVRVRAINTTGQSGPTRPYCEGN